MSKPSLIILDDDEQTGVTIQHIAEYAGLDSYFTDSPDEFLTRIIATPPDFIVLDLIMPGMDGVEVIQQLAGLDLQSQIIITSGAGQRILDAASRSVSAHGLNVLGTLQKPFSPKTFRDLVQKSTKMSAKDNAKRSETKALSATPDYRTLVTLESVREAIAKKQITIAVQPKFESRFHLVNGFEVLARWHHAEYGNIPPYYFIDIAEKHDLIDDLTRLVMQQAVPFLAQLIEQSSTSDFTGDARSLTLAINISALSLHSNDLFSELEALLKEYKLSPERIILELTETGAMADPVASLDLLTRLRIKGFRLSIDDFGTGYSSLLQLVRLPFTEVKIDRSFVHSAVTSDESRKVIKGIVDLAHALDMDVTAEGVEDAETLEYLHDVGCDLIQGFYFARPMDVEQAMRWLLQREPAAEEHFRVNALHAMQILDTPQEERFNRLTRLAKKVFQVPTVMISLVDSDRLWFKSFEGISGPEAPRKDSFCDIAVHDRNILLVPNALEDPRFSDNPNVLGSPNIRFYAGQPIASPYGEMVGSFCVIDIEPRDITSTDQRLLKAITQLVETELLSEPPRESEMNQFVFQHRQFETRANDLVSLCNRFSLGVSLFHFEVENIGCGNAWRERVFQSALERAFHDADLIGRVGDGEFMVLLVEDSNSATSAASQADTLIHKLRNLLMIAELSEDGEAPSFYYGTCSSTAEAAKNLQELYSATDEILQNARKKDG
ncbi:EAL domain-containing protein [Idiomarina sp. A28L]|uniref:EAL domain-containing protein n=1 Tax=Idiomarina sp. A28L TaxID=1036674 RepID=UPI0002138816|nr:EAL domain-containing protein [Idiomarina sp. A28L]EGN75133.1 EAL domain-containing protein [Idiomarina sp. A28L]